MSAGLWTARFCWFALMLVPMWRDAPDVPLANAVLLGLWFGLLDCKLQTP